MAILDLYSRRKRQAERAGQPDVYQYEDLPNRLRVQIVNLWKRATGPTSIRTESGFDIANDKSLEFWQSIESAMSQEKGVPELAHERDPFDRCVKYFLSQSTQIDDLLDLLEMSFHCIAGLGQLSEWQRSERQISMTAAEAVKELNFRLRDAGVGFQFENGKIVRIDSQYLHAESVKPALALLSDPRFEGPRQEFLHAHEMYRTAKPRGNKKREDAITAALKALESTLKVICDLKKWQYPANATAVPLIKIVIQNGLIPPFLQSSMEGLATLRNNIGGHGQGGQVRNVPSHLAAYALNLAASNIVMLVEAFKESEPRP